MLAKWTAEGSKSVLVTAALFIRRSRICKTIGKTCVTTRHEVWDFPLAREMWRQRARAYSRCH